MLLLPAVAGAVLLVAQARPSADSILLRVLATNDFHGSLEAGVQAWSNHRPVGGAAAVAGMMDRLARACSCVTIRLDGGDVMQGSPVSNLTWGRATVDAFNLMGYAAAAVGNHEFDWGVDTLAVRVRQARFAWLSANVRDRAGGATPPWTAPWRMVIAGGRRIAVVGYSTESTPSTTRPSNVAALSFDSGPARLDAAIAAARAERPDWVIVVAHAGAFCTPDGGCAGEVVDLAAALHNRPDLIVSGHTHTLVETTVNGIPIVQARSNGIALGIVDFVDSAGVRVVRMRVETVWADRETADTAVARLVATEARRVAPLTSRVVATLAGPLVRSGDQYPLGNLIADADRAATGADVALVNNGGIRADLAAGPVTWGALFEVEPFQNFLVKLRVTGAVLRRTLEHAVGTGEARAHVSGVTVRVNSAAPEGQRVIAVALAGGRPLADSAWYTVSVPDFVAAGGSGYAMLRGAAAENSGTVDLDALSEWLRKLPQPVQPPEDVRVQEAGR
ncbi:MAG TPA: 5'-nucleotidase C-terminal domain-containing protein [Gemmatimonadales bacterium]|nr:5'-nucleotidase C-terminal domain-containing protein [Gemmatimonadales bacterium]